MPIRGVNHITLVVSDLPRSLAFYRDTLGAELRAQGPRAAYLELGALWLCLERGAPDQRDDDSHIALDCAEADFEALAARIRLSASLWKQNVSEGASLYFLDPDGHRLELHVGDLESRLSDYSAQADAPMMVIK